MQAATSPALTSDSGTASARPLATCAPGASEKLRASTRRMSAPGSTAVISQPSGSVALSAAVGLPGPAPRSTATRRSVAQALKSIRNASTG